MLLVLTFSRPPSAPWPATEVGYLLHKHPDRVHTRVLSYGACHVVTAEATAERCEVALLVDIDPVALVRGRAGSGPRGGPLDQYVNDRPYVASSLLSVALAEQFRSALGGRCAQRPELVEVAWPVTVQLPVVPARGGEALLRQLFEPLGYTVEAESWPCDEAVPRWGASGLVRLTLSHTLTVRAVLQHLYVLVPVLDDDKHYWVGEAEVDKLLRRGEDWLPAHPAREAIAHRYLKRRRPLTRRALAHWREEAPPREGEAAEAPPRSPSLQRRRIAWVAERLASLGATTICDAGCGEGQLLKALLFDRRITRLVGLDPSPVVLARCARRLNLDERAPAVRDRVELVQGALGWRDRRLDGLDAVALVEVIEHIDADRLPQVVSALFGANRPRHVVVTTPNAEANVRYGLAHGARRHRDHRFEWDRATFGRWAHEVGQAHGYSVALHGVGDDPDDGHGPPTQAAIFSLRVATEVPPCP